MKVAVLTATYDNYDPLKELPAQSMPHEAIALTDNPDLKSDSWNVVYRPREQVHPNRAAKPPKCCPWLYTDADVAIWIDASWQVQSNMFVQDLVELTDEHPIWQFKHLNRDCLYDEANYSMTVPKYFGQPLDKQVARYEDWGVPKHWGLWATGMIAMRQTPEVARMGVAWLDEINRFSFQDQVSQPAVLRQVGLRPKDLPGTYWVNPWAQLKISARH